MVVLVFEASMTMRAREMTIGMYRDRHKPHVAGIADRTRAFGVEFQMCTADVRDLTIGPQCRV